MKLLVINMWEEQCQVYLWTSPQFAIAPPFFTQQSSILDQAIEENFPFLPLNMQKIAEFLIASLVQMICSLFNWLLTTPLKGFPVSQFLAYQVC
jgi:hypothetical protein